MTLVFDIVAQKLIISNQVIGNSLFVVLLMTDLEHCLGEEIITLEICELTSKKQLFDPL